MSERATRAEGVETVRWDGKGGGGGRRGLRRLGPMGRRGDSGLSESDGADKGDRRLSTTTRADGDENWKRATRVEGVEIVRRGGGTVTEIAPRVEPRGSGGRGRQIQAVDLERARGLERHPEGSRPSAV